MGEALRLGVLASGRGSNLQAILDAIAGHKLVARVVLVACNHEGAGAISKAEQAGVPVALYSGDEYRSRAAQQRAIAAALQEARAQLVVCAGWDRVLTPEFVGAFRGRIINIHPSLLPAFGGGLHAIEEALHYGVKITGCTVHFVTDEVDAGPVIAQAAVAVDENDTVETLAEKIHREEHRLVVEAIRLYSEKRIQVDGRTVRITEGRG